MSDQSRNLNAHAAAHVAACLWNERYAHQRDGLMDFWDTLSKGERSICARVANNIREARPYTGGLRHD
jgi:hypothetical protein